MGGRASGRTIAGMADPNRDPERRAQHRELAERPGRARWSSAWLKVPDRLCSKCGQRPATARWVGEGGGWALSHGAYTWWCDVCVIEAQLEHARGRAAAIPELERRLEEALDVGGRLRA